MSRTRITALIVVLGLVIALVAVVVGTSSPRVCAGCHAMRPYADAVAETAHAPLSCYDCHAPVAWDRASQKTRELTAMYPRALFGAREVTGVARRVSSAGCVECHAGIFSVVTERNGMRISHGDCVRPGAACESCHSAALHREATRWVRQPVMEECVACHRQNPGPTACDACHDGKLRTERLAVGPWAITHGPDWREMHGNGSIASCSTCHPADYCVDCHGIDLPHPEGFGRIHGSMATAPEATCDTCHRDGTFCDGCHGTEMPHAETFLAEHPEIAEDRADPRCMECHRVGDCNACHVKHTHPGSTSGRLGGSD